MKRHPVPSFGMISRLLPLREREHAHLIGVNSPEPLPRIHHPHAKDMYGGEEYRMGKKDTYRHVVRQCATGAGAASSFIAPQRPELTPELQKYLHVLGPTPKRCLETLADLGLSDGEIGRYFQMPCGFVTDLRDIWNIKGNS